MRNRSAWMSLLWIYLASSSSLIGSEEKGSFLQKIQEMKVESKEAFYDGKQLKLEGQVSLENAFGKISAHRLLLAPIDLKEKTKTLPVMRLYQEVQIALQAGGHLFCAEAEVDFASRQAWLFSDEAHPDVLYTKESKGKEDKVKPLEMRSTQLKIELTRQLEPEEISSKIELQAIEACGNVRLSYAGNYFLSGDLARYEAMAGGSSRAEAKGVVTLTNQAGAQECLLENSLGDSLRSKKMVVNLAEETIEMFEPHGSFALKNTGQEAIDWTFSAQRLKLKEIDHKVELQGSVFLQTFLGELWAEQATLYYVKKQKEQILQKIILEGEVRLKQLLPALEEGQEPPKREALADRVECLLCEKEMWLSAQEAKRVLLFDGVSHMEMSAPSLKINWGSSVDDFAVQGSGDVRFLFLEHEVKNFKSLFNRDRAAQSSKSKESQDASSD